MQSSSWTQRPGGVESAYRHDRADVAVGSSVILLAEDDGAVRSLLARVLRSRGYTVIEAANGAEAIAAADSYPLPFQLLLTDVVMPKLTGPELASRLLASGKAQRVIYMTGYTDLLLETGEHVTVLHKPFTPTTLTDAVRTALAG